MCLWLTMNSGLCIVERDGQRAGWLKANCSFWTHTKKKKGK